MKNIEGVPFPSLDFFKQNSHSSTVVPRNETGILQMGRQIIQLIPQ